MSPQSPAVSVPDRAPAPRARLAAHDSQRVLRHGEPRFGDQLGARDVWVFEAGGRYFMHYDAAGESGWLATLATSDDGLDWTKVGPILTLGAEGRQDSASASYGTTFHDGDRWHLFYLGTPNVTPDELKVPSFPYMTMKAEATGPTGPWTKQYDVTPFVAEAGSWYSDTASPGAIVPVDDGYAMLFSAATTDEDGRIWRTLGIARTADLDRSWTVDPQPLLPLTEQIENSSLYFEPANGLWFLFTNHIADADDHPAVPPQNSTEYTDAVWVYWAESIDGFRPEHKAVALDAASSGWSPRVIGLPSVIRIGDRLAVYYDGAEEDTIGHGHRDVGVAWLDLPLEPPV